MWRCTAHWSGWMVAAVTSLNSETDSYADSDSAVLVPILFFYYCYRSWTGQGRTGDTAIHRYTSRHGTQHNCNVRNGHLRCKREIPDIPLPDIRLNSCELHQQSERNTISS